jgi:hypothetical protein
MRSSDTPKQPTSHCFNCRDGEHAKCDAAGTTLCACHHAGHETGEQ